MHLSQSDVFKTLGTIIDKLIFTLGNETQKYNSRITIKVDNDEWFYVMVATSRKKNHGPLQSYPTDIL